MENINIGSTPNDGTGDNLRTAFDKTIKNFDELYSDKSNLSGATFTGNISATNLSGTNSGDETKSSIETKLGTASSSNSGFLSSTDWTTFNNKANISQTITDGVTTSSPSEDVVFDNLALKANLTGATFTGNISATNLSGTNSGDETKSSIESKLGTASSSNSGFLSSTDWTTFNNKANISQTITNGVITSSPSEDAVFDALALKLNSEPFQLSIVTTSNFSTSDTISGYSMYGKNIVVNNGVTPINIDVSSYDGFICSFLKNSNANIVFTQGTGRTLVLSSNTNTLTGTLGSTAVISSVGTKDFLKIDNR